MLLNFSKLGVKREIILLSLVLFIPFCYAASVGCNPPASGDWVLNGSNTTVCQDQTINSTAWIKIYYNSSIVFENVTWNNMHRSYAYDNSTVTMIDSNISINHTYIYDNTTLQIHDSDYYTYINTDCRNNATFIINNSYVDSETDCRGMSELYVYDSYVRWPILDESTEGNFFGNLSFVDINVEESATAVINNSYIYDSGEFDIIENAHLTIQNTQIFKNTSTMEFYFDERSRAELINVTINVTIEFYVRNASTAYLTDVNTSESLYLFIYNDSKAQVDNSELTTVYTHQNAAINSSNSHFGFVIFPTEDSSIHIDNRQLHYPGFRQDIVFNISKGSDINLSSHLFKGSLINAQQQNVTVFVNNSNLTNLYLSSFSGYNRIENSQTYALLISNNHSNNFIFNMSVNSMACGNSSYTEVRNPRGDTSFGMYGRSTVEFVDSSIYEFDAVGYFNQRSSVTVIGDLQISTDGINDFDIDSQLVRQYKVNLTRDGDIYNNRTYIVDGNDNVYFNTSTTNGIGYINMTFNSSNYQSQFYLADVYLDTFYGITPTTDTPVSADTYQEDLSKYPNMFITDGNFDGLLVVGKTANALNTIAVTNIALGLQGEAFSTSVVCPENDTTTVYSAFEIDTGGDEYNIGDEIFDVFNIPVDDGDMPIILADGEYKDNQGNNVNDVAYTQTIEFYADTGDIVYDQDDLDAPNAAVYLKWSLNQEIYQYRLAFDDDVDYDPYNADADFVGTDLEIQGVSYTITDVAQNPNGTIRRIDLMKHVTSLWIEEQEYIKKTIGGTQHNITLLDVTSDTGACGLLVDGTNVWIDVHDIETVNSINIGVLDARHVTSPAGTTDICKISIGSEQLRLEQGQEVEINGSDITGSDVDIICSDNESLWDIYIYYDPSDDIYLTTNDEYDDPVLGYWRFLVGGPQATYENIDFTASGTDGELKFISTDNEEIEIEFYYDPVSGEIFTADNNLSMDNPDDGTYFEGDRCIHNSGDLTDCVGSNFIVVTSDNVTHLIEISSIDDIGFADPEIDLDDLTYGTSTNNNDYGNNSAICVGLGQYSCNFSLGSGVGQIILTFNETEGWLEFTDISKGSMKTKNGAIIEISGNQGNRTNITITENNALGLETVLQFNITNQSGNIAITLPTNISGGLMGPVDRNAADDDNQSWATVWGSIVEVNTLDYSTMILRHPDDQLLFRVYMEPSNSIRQVIAETGCTSSQSINAIPSTANKFDTEVSDPYAQNLISVGYACTNTVTDDLLENPTDCKAGLSDNQGGLFLHVNTSYQLAVYGYSDRETHLLSQMLRDFDNASFSGYNMTFTFSAEASNNNNNNNNNDDDDDDDSSSSSSSTSSSSPSGGSSSTSGAIATIKRTFIDLAKDAVAEVDIISEKIAVSKIEIKIKESVTGATKVTVSSLADKPENVKKSASKRVYQYLEIETSNLDDDAIADVSIGFSVEKGWLDEQGSSIEMVTLMRYDKDDEEWDVLRTELDSEDGDQVHFKAYSSGFSTFAISLQDEEEEQEPEIEQPLNVTEEITEPEPIVEEKVVEVQAPRPEPKPKWNLTWLWIGLALVAVGGLVFYFTQSQILKTDKSEKKVDDTTSIHNVINTILDEALKGGYKEATLKEKLKDTFHEEDIVNAFNTIRTIHHYIKTNHQQGVKLYDIESLLWSKGWDPGSVDKILMLMGLKNPFASAGRPQNPQAASQNQQPPRT